jgi:hypothetical protein
LCCSLRGRGAAGGGHPSDHPGGVTVSQQSWADCRRGINAAIRRGSERGESSTYPFSSSPAHPCILACVQVSMYVCGGRVGGCVGVRTRGRVHEGVWREGKREVRQEVGMGEADGVIAGYSWRLCVCESYVFIRKCVFLRAYVFVCVFLCLLTCDGVRVCIRACVSLIKPLRSPSRRMQRTDHHRLFQST